MSTTDDATPTAPTGMSFRLLVRSILHHRLATVGLVIAFLLSGITAIGPWIVPYGLDDQDLYNVLAGPSAAHWLGTDNLGRDLLTRFISGGQVSLLFGLITTVLAAAMGITLGLLAGYSGGLIDALIMRVVDAFLCFPGLFFLLAIATALGPGIHNVGLTIVLFGWTFFARLVRGQVLVVRELPFVEAARVAGASPARIMWRHVLPNTLAPLIVGMTFFIGGVILAESVAAFLGLGVQPPTQSWGIELSNGFTYLEQSPLYSIVPGLLIMLAVLSCNFVGDGLRDALDPRLRGENQK